MLSSCNNNNTSQYEGIWEGTFNGDREGTWKIGIEDEGKARGVMTPLDEELGFTVEGNVNGDGELIMTATVFGRDAVYRAFLSETDLSGDWTAQEDDFSGSWSGSKNQNEDNFPYNLILNP